jgi:hypothetical protein
MSSRLYLVLFVHVIQPTSVFASPTFAKLLANLSESTDLVPHRRILATLDAKAQHAAECAFPKRLESHAMPHLHAVRAGLGVISRPSTLLSASSFVRTGTEESRRHLPLASCSSVSLPDFMSSEINCLDLVET